MPTDRLSLNFILRVAAHRADLLVDDGAGDTVLSEAVNIVSAIVQINFECAALWDALVSSYEDYCVQHVTIPVRGNQETYILPEDFYKFRKVFPIVNGTRGTVLRKFQLKDLGYADSIVPIQTSRIEDTQYRITGNRLMLHPVPTAASQLELWYVPVVKSVTNLEDKVDFRFPAGWEEYITEGLAAWMLEKEESDSTAVRAQQAKVLGRILSMVEDRDAGEPFQMIDVEDQLE